MRPRIPTNRKNVKSLASARQQSQGLGGDDGNLGMHQQSSGQQHSLLGQSAHFVNGPFPATLQKPVPSIPHDGPLQFEVFIFVYSMIALFLQYLHLYKSVWWLPHSYNAYAMNFYLIDPQLIAFCGLVLVRRVIWTIEKKFIIAVTPAAWAQSFVIVARSLNTLVVLFGLLWLAYGIVQLHPVVNMLYLTYPISVYFLLFGLSGEPFLELTPPSPIIGKIRMFVDSKGVYRTNGPSSLPYLPTPSPGTSGTTLTPGANTSPGGTGASNTPNSSNNPYQCAAGYLFQPELVRQEVSVMKQDFNMRLKQILFNSIVSVYYGAIVPCLFAQSTLHYDLAWVGRHSLLVWVGAFVLYVIHCFPATYTIMMHRTATILGQWTKIEGRVSPTFYNQWNNTLIWPFGAIVRHGKGDLYKAEGDVNCAEPGNSSQSRFYSVFREPSLLLSILLMVQSGLVLAQHVSLTWSTHWYQLISEGIMLFGNYYALFKLVRDYIVFWRFFVVDNNKEQRSKDS